MTNALNLVGRPVIARANGEQVGEVRDLVISRDGTQVLGVEVNTSGLLAGSRYFLWESIESAGEDAIIIDSLESLRKSDEFPSVKEVLERGNALTGRHVHTTSGRSLGRIESIFLDLRTGSVVGYELAEGPHADDQGARSFLPATMQMETGKDVVFVLPESENTLEDIHVALRGDEPKAA